MSCPKCGGMTSSMTEKEGTAIWCIGGPDKDQVCGYSKFIESEIESDFADKEIMYGKKILKKDMFNGY